MSWDSALLRSEQYGLGNDRIKFMFLKYYNDQAIKILLEVPVAVENSPLKLLWIIWITGRSEVYTICRSNNYILW